MLYLLDDIYLLCHNRRTHMLQKSLLMCVLIIKLTGVVVRMTMESAESLLTLTSHITQHKLLLATSILTKGHLRGGF